MTLSLQSEKKIRFILHLVGWIILFVIPAYLLYVDSSHDLFFLIQAYIQILFYAILFYLNYLILAPRLFFRKRRLAYFLSAIFVILATTVLMEVTNTFMPRNKPLDLRFELPRSFFRPDDRPPPPMRPPGLEQLPRPSKNWPTYNFMMTCFLISGFGLGLSFYDRLTQNEKKREVVEKERLNSELAFLKNQINPHFFFNTLNNIYSLVQTNVKEGQKAILQLSKLMRYLLYETEKGDNPVIQEIEFMQSYIELIKLRLSNKVSLNITFPDQDPDISIPPLLFLPFIENAFKHGISYRKPSYINILLKVNPEEIYFECINSTGTQGEEPVSAGTGIGLDNVRKRLNLLYPKNHSLQIISTETSFTIVLVINLPKSETT